MKSATPLFVLAGLCALLFTGCASPAKSTAMVPKGIQVARHHPASANVEVVGGNKTNPMWKSDISNEDFAAAVVETLRECSLFSSVADIGGDYKLKVQLIKVMSPSIGFTFTTTVVSQWQLI